jgi:hypothetical protein
MRKEKKLKSKKNVSKEILAERRFIRKNLIGHDSCGKCECSGTCCG